MARVKIKVERGNGLQQVVTIDTAATEGATIGKNVYNPDGSLYAPASGGASANVRNGYGILISGNAVKTISVNRAANFDWQGQHNWEKALWAPDGTAAAPAYTFGAQKDLGAYRVGANNYGIATGGVLRWDVNTARTYQSVMLQARVADGYIARLENLTDPDAGVRVYTEFAPLGSDTYLDFHENAARYFRLGNRGNPASDAFFELSRVGASGAFDGTIFSAPREQTGIDFLQQLRVADGTQSAPAIAFTQQAKLGFFRDASTESIRCALPVSVNAAAAFEVVGDGTGTNFTRIRARASATASAARSAFQHISSGGAILAAFNMQNTNSAGLPANLASLVASAGIAFNPGGTNANATSFAWYMAASGNFRAGDNVELALGTGSDLRLFHNGTNSTIRNDTGNLSINSGATEVLRFIQGANSRVHALNGTAALPTFGWFGDPDNGLYYITTNSFGVATAGTLRYQFGAAGQFGIGGATYGTANTQAIVSGGASAAPSWQTVLVDGQTQSLSGIYTFTNTLTNTGAMRVEGNSGASWGWVCTGAATDAKRWRAYVAATEWGLSTLTDADGGPARNVLLASRSGNSISAMAYGNPTDNPPHTFYGNMIFNSLSATAVSLGDPDSGGTGFRCLRVPN